MKTFKLKTEQFKHVRKTVQRNIAPKKALSLFISSLVPHTVTGLVAGRSAGQRPAGAPGSHRHHRPAPAAGRQQAHLRRQMKSSPVWELVICKL